MSKIKELFFRDAYTENRNILRDDVVKFIDYINNVGDENSLFDAKDMGKILDDNLNISLDKVRVQLGKHISAMANTSGGLIGIGIKENKSKNGVRFSLNNYDLSKVNLQQLQRALATAAEPKVEFYVEVVEINRRGGYSEGIIMIFIEQSLSPPHQVVHNRTYYFRHGESSEPAAHSLVSALFTKRRKAVLEIDLIKQGDPIHQRVLIKNKGNAPAQHTHIVVNIFPRLIKNDEILLTKRMIERSSDGLWNIKPFLGTKKQNFMKFRFRAKPSQIILPGINEILFDFPFETFPDIKLRADLFCDGFEGHQEFELF